MQARARGALIWGLASVIAGASSCSSLPDIDRNVCGNGVVEPDNHEDCDDGTLDDAGHSLCYPAGSAGQCHFDCSADDCPAGFSCGNDAICRKPSGIFKDTGHATQIDADRLLAGDFDHDGLGDVVAQTAVQMNVLFGDNTGGLSEPFTVRSTNASPTVGLLALDPDGGASEPYSDLIFTAADGVTTWRGRQDRTLAPTPYASLQIGNAESRVIEARTITPFDDVMVLTPLDQFKSGAPGCALGEIDANEAPDTNDAFALFLDALPSDLVGNVVIANFRASPNFPCDDIALAFGTALRSARVTVVTTCADPTTLNVAPVSSDGGTMPLAVPLQDVALPAGATIRPGGNGASAADINGDGVPDLMIDAVGPYIDESGSLVTGEETLFAFSTGDGNFTDGSGSPDGLNKFSALPLIRGGIDILAAGQLTTPTDKSPDVVTTLGIALTFPLVGADEDSGVDGGPKLDGMVIAAPQPWIDARIADIDADGFNDVVAGSSGQVDIYRGSGSSIHEMGVVQYAVDGAASQFAIGDFDGDRVPDIAFRADHGDGTADLDVMWGHLLGQPDDPVVVGRFGNIRTIGTGVISNDLGGQDSIGDLGVVIEGPDLPGTDAGPFSVSVLAGTTNRQLQAPFIIQQPSTTISNTRNLGFPLAFSVGQLSAGDRHADLASGVAVQRYVDAGSAPDAGASNFSDIELAITQSTGLAQLSSDVSQLKFTAKLDTFAFSTSCVGSACNLAVADWNHLLLTTADLDGAPKADGTIPGNGVDEIIGIAPAVQTGQTFHDVSATGQLVVARFDGNNWNAQSAGLGIVPSAINGIAPSPIASIASADVNGDGNTDVLALKSDAFQTSLLAYINNGSGQLPAKTTVISLPSYSTDPQARFQIVSIAAIDADGDPGKEIAMLTDHGGLFMAKSNAAGDAFTVTGPLCDNGALTTCADVRSQRIPAGQAIAAIDVDGDGIQDLVIESDLTLRVYKGLAVDP